MSDFDLVLGPDDGKAVGLAWNGSALLVSRPAEGLLLRVDAGTGDVDVARRFANGVTGLAVAPDGSLYGCQTPSRRIVRFDEDGSMSAMAHRLAGRLHNRPRAADVDDAGRIWFSDPWTGPTNPGPQLFPLLDHASVLRLERQPNGDWHLRRMTHDTRAPGAVLVSADQSTLFVSEHAEDGEGGRELRAYPVDGDELGPCTVLQTFGADHRGPHRGVAGMCLDADGNLVATVGGSAAGPGPMVVVLTPTGRVLHSVPAPEDLLAVTFGGADLDELYVTTAAGSVLRLSGHGLRGRSRA